MTSGVKPVSAWAICVVPKKRRMRMSCWVVSALTKMRRKRTPEPTVKGPFRAAHPFAVVGSVPENGMVSVSAWL